MTNITFNMSEDKLVSFDTKNSLMPKIDHPFFIVTPPYVRTSAGITVLHLLCHYLNISGENAFIIHHPSQQTAIRSLPSYCAAVEQPQLPGGVLAPILTQNFLEFYDKKRLTPIVIYPEVYDNPLKASFFGRYILNFPGKIAPKYNEIEDFSFSYTKTLGDSCTALYPDRPPTKDVLFVPTCDLGFWNTKGAAARRQGSCYYCAKLKDVHHEQPEGVPEGSVEILRSMDMSREEIREIFWRSEAFYCYEDTALSIEANLCGCPTVHVPNRFYSGVSLAENELGLDGSCLSGDAEGFARAQRTVAKFEQTMRTHIALAPSHLARLAARWKAMAAEQDYRGTITPPKATLLVYLDRRMPTQLGFAAADGVGPGLPAAAKPERDANGPFDPLTIREVLAALLLAIKRSVVCRFPLTAKLLRPLYRIATGRPLKDDNSTG